MKDKKIKPEILDIVPTEPSEVKAVKPESEFKRKTRIFMRKLLVWAILVLAGFLAGAAIVFFAGYLPKLNENKALKSENSTLTADLTTSQAALTQSQADYETCSQDLLSTQAMLNQTASVKYAALMLFQATVARAKLESNDWSGATSSLSNAESYFNNLEPLIEDQAALQSINSSMNGAKTKMAISSSGAIDDLTTLINSLYDLLLRLSNNT
jgi:hypothetical protein